MNIEEVKSVLNYLLDNNLQLVEKGLDKISVNLCGPAGIAKTTCVQQLAKERGARYVKLNLAELEEIGDLVGIPQKQYLMRSPSGEEVRVVEKVINQYATMGYTLCPDCDPVMTYAIPSWVPTDPEEEVIINLDDYLRASQLFMNATMSLIQFGEYMSWSLPKKCHIILTSNPNDGEYGNISELDPAQQSRMITFDVTFDVNVWARWADKAGLPSFAINFALLTPEVFERGAHINARSFTLFANSAAGLGDISTTENLATLCMLAQGCFKDEWVSGMLTQFVYNKLDRLMEAKDILGKEWKDAKRMLEENIYRNGKYDASIASTLTIRFTNYIDEYFSKSVTDKNKSEKVIDRIIALCTDVDKTLLTEDLLYKMVKSINAKHPVRCQKLLKYPAIRAKLL